MYRLHNLNVCVPERGSLGARLDLVKNFGTLMARFTHPNDRGIIEVT